MVIISITYHHPVVNLVIYKLDSLIYRRVVEYYFIIIQWFGMKQVLCMDILSFYDDWICINWFLLKEYDLINNCEIIIFSYL